MSRCQVTILSENISTHNLCFTQKPFEVVFLNVHQAADVRDIKVTVLHMLGFQVYLGTWNTCMSSRKYHSTEKTTDYLSDFQEPFYQDKHISSNCTEEQCRVYGLYTGAAGDLCGYLVEFLQQP